MRPLKIGILNVMHDKEATNQRFTHVLTENQVPVDLFFYYPKTHYQGRAVPADVAAILQPLDLEQVKILDAFIITGAPIEQLDFTEITYIDEVQQLLLVLREHVPNLLFVCWGGMVAANFYYGIEKGTFNNGQKLFGVFPNQIVAPDPLLKGLTDGFLAPHARYAELKYDQVFATPELTITAQTKERKLFSMRTADSRQNYLFAHLEYDRAGLRDEYRREIAAHPDRFYKLPLNDWDPVTDTTPFAWQAVQETYYRNWVNLVAHNLNTNESERS